MASSWQRDEKAETEVKEGSEHARNRRGTRQHSPSLFIPHLIFFSPFFVVYFYL